MRTLDEMREYFQVDLRERIVGLTPYLTGLDSLGGRQREIEAWLAQNNYEKTDWIALDDIDDLFDFGCEHLVLVAGGEGIDDESEAALRSALTRKR